jgi:IS5 family transposase
MKPKAKVSQSAKLFEHRLDEIINMNHSLVKLAQVIDWSVFEREWAGYFPSKRGRPATAARMVAGLLYLQHIFNCSDELLVDTWVENPYWQYFCGESYLQHEPPADFSSLSRWRSKMGEQGVEWLLTATIDAARHTKLIEPASVEKLIVDTTVMEKAITYPTDSKLLEGARQRLVKLAGHNGFRLRQNYNRVAPRLAQQIARYAHAKQFKRMKRCVKHLRTLLGRVWRDIERQAQALSGKRLLEASQELSLVRRLLDQKPKDKNKLYSLHAPEVQCISKGKARQRYEFGVKVSVATTLREGLVVGMRAMPGNPYDGHTLEEALEQAEILSGRRARSVFVDRGYRGAQPAGVSVYVSGQRRGMTRRLKAELKRRSAIEPMIGHMKNDGRLARNWLKGSLGDRLHAVLCGAGHNLRMILRKLRLLFALILGGVLEGQRQPETIPHAI